MAQLRGLLSAFSIIIFFIIHYFFIMLTTQVCVALMSDLVDVEQNLEKKKKKKN